MIVGGIDTDQRILVVAEIGNNHEGDVNVALELVDRAAEAGADAVKFQTFRTEHFVSRSDEARFERLKRFELTPDEFAALAERTRARGLLFISTPLDIGSAAVLEPLVDAFKIASGDNTFWPLVARVLEAGKPVIASTGLAELNEVDELVSFVRAHWGEERTRAGFALLHCVTAYPVEPEEASLAAIRILADRYGLTVGYSDHTVGVEAAPLAVAAGARVVEKHFTLDKGYSDFRDHRLSADPPELGALVESLRRASTFLGRSEKRPQPSEEPGRVALRRSIVAAADLAAGHTLGSGDLTWTRPGGGLEPGREEELIGRSLRRPVRIGERLVPDDVE